MIINNSTYINKINNHLSHKIIEHKKNTMIYCIRNLAPGLGQAQKCGGIKLVNGVTTLPLLDLQRQYRFKQTIKIPAQIHFQSKIPHNITNKNDNINMDSTIAGSMNACN